MTQAVTVRRDGDTFQARWFWSKAVSLLDTESPVVRVGFEVGPKGFDDVWVDYDPKCALIDQHGKPLLREHVQCKWHTSPGTFGYADLVDPEFINANARSLLGRARAAQQDYASSGVGARFRLLTNWQIARNDPLRRLVSNRSHCVRVDELFGTATDASMMGRVRKLWRDHLEIDDRELQVFARVLAISTAHESLDGLRDNLDLAFRVVGLRRIPSSESSFVYDDLVFQWLAQGKLLFDRDGFRTACESEHLLDRGGSRPRVFGVKSFEHPIDKLEERCTAVLNLLPHFNERQIRSDSDWCSTLYPQLKSFLLGAAKDVERLRLGLDAHLTLSFAAGSVLNMKCGRTVELEQRTLARTVWAPDDVDHDPSWPTLVFDEVALHREGSEVAVAVSLTHDIGEAVQTYIQRALPQVGVLLTSRPTGAPGARSVACGRHAFELAEALTARVRATQSDGRRTGTIHLFMACPSGFAFLLGQRQPAVGRLIVYEFDFEGTNGGSYTPSLSFPLVEAPCAAKHERPKPPGLASARRAGQR